MHTFEPGTQLQGRAVDLVVFAIRANARRGRDARKRLVRRCIVAVSILIPFGMTAAAAYAAHAIAVG